MHVDYARLRLGQVFLKRAFRAIARAGIAAFSMTVLLVFTLGASQPAHGATAFIEGEAFYAQRMLPPPNATLVVTLQDASRVGAAAIELASISLRVTSGPPYAWRLVYDASADLQRLTVRARITTPAGLWMTTDTVVNALSAAPLRLQLVAVGAAPQQNVPVSGTADAASSPTMASADATASANAVVQVCTNAVTQAELNRCAFEDFEAAGSGYAQRYKELSQPLAKAQRDRLLRMQNAWLTYRTEACRYESGASAGGSVQVFVYWRCAARLTRERTQALQALAACREGDVTCTRRTP